MSRDVSAFANSRGGFLIYGLDDSGKIDGGVPVDLMNGTIEWLDNLVPGLVEPRLRGYRLKRIERSGANSAIQNGNAVIVIEFPDSEDAPHQARDNRYYIRNNGKKEPADHGIVEDIRSRKKGPRLSASLKVTGVRRSHQQSQSEVLIVDFDLFLHLANLGTSTARDLFLVITVPKYMRFKPYALESFHSFEFSEGKFSARIEMPLHPNQEAVLLLGTAILAFEAAHRWRENQSKATVGGIPMPATLFAEDARPLILLERLNTPETGQHILNFLEHL